MTINSPRGGENSYNIKKDLLFILLDSLDLFYKSMFFMLNNNNLNINSNYNITYCYKETNL